MKNALKYVISFVLAFGLIFWVYKDQDLGLLWRETLSMNLWWLGLSYFAAFAAHWIRGARWVLLAENIEHKVNNLSSFYSVMLGYAINLVIPRGGELARCGYLQKEEKIPFSKTLGTVVIERMVDFVVMGLFVFFSLFLEYDKILSFINQNKSNQDNEGNFLIWILMVLMLIFFVVFYFLRKRIFQNTFVKNLIEGLLSITKQKRPFLFVIYSLGIWFFYYMMMFFALKAYPATAHLSPSIALAILMISTLGMIVPVPGGTGAYHYLVTKGLIAYGIIEINATTFAAVSHALQVFEILSLFLTCQIFVGLIKNKPIIANHSH
ncbi:MAG: lysylphosphatidylglycerol synthase transmembrane domain-containing protein [Cytophagales bacterium]